MTSPSPGQRNANDCTNDRSVGARGRGTAPLDGDSRNICPTRINNSYANSTNPRGYVTRAANSRYNGTSHMPSSAITSAPARAQHIPIAHPIDYAHGIEYEHWPEIRVRIAEIPSKYADTWFLYRTFSKFGQICFIAIENAGYNYGGARARVVFNTPPEVAFWTRNMSFQLEDGSSSRNLHINRPERGESGEVRSPVDEAVKFPKLLTMPVAFLTFGLMSRSEELISMHRLSAETKHPIRLTLDLSEGRQKIDMRYSIQQDGQVGPRRFCLQANLETIASVSRYRDQERVYLVISLREPPRYFRQSSDIARTHATRTTMWKEWPKMWERQTDINHDMEARDTEPIALVRSDAIIDTGRWLTYRLDFRPNDKNVNLFCKILNHHNIRIRELCDFELLQRYETEAWKYLDPHKASHPSDLHEMQDDLVHLDFDVRYQLEVCISQHRLNEYNMKLDFFQQLSSLDKTTALDLLGNVADSKRMYLDPMTIFAQYELRGSRKRRAPQGCILMHAVTVTPTTLRITTPTIEVSNRVIRDNSHVDDHFLRVKFEDEEYIGRLHSAPVHGNQEEIYGRIRRALKQGIYIAGRHYDFLAHGNSQFREHGAYYFAKTSDKNADQIRASLGQFDKINIVAKYAARIGQCFSTTRSITQLPRNLKRIFIEDVFGSQNGKQYCFTDGVGKVSSFVAQMIADEFRLTSNPGEYPSVYQFRMGGHKGVLAVDPALKGTTVALRPSQSKFTTNTEGLEIIRVSSFAQAYLNQQIILVLSALGVPDQVFVDKMVAELYKIDLAMTDSREALELLSRNVDFNQVVLAMSEMIMDGFMDTKEPMLMSLLQLWRAWRIKLLKEKAHIPIGDGAFVLGCTDETQTLRMDGHGNMPEIFIQVKDRLTNKYTPRQGLCLIARNPSLHPGDVRMVRGVACKGLDHLKDVVVFPQKGERDLANMLSGGDLDGDDYLVIWDEVLFPPATSWNFSPMDFTGPLPKMSIDTVTKDQLVENFIDYIRYDVLGKIAVQHRAWADYHSNLGGVRHENCLRLADLHSIAVDFPKSGVPAQIDEHLAQLPNYPHWMDRRDKRRTYHSKSVLGQLYDRVIRQDFHPQYSNRFDQRILDAYTVSEDTLATVRELKLDYDADVRRIMAQQGVLTEFEIWSSFVLLHNREKREYQFAEEMGRLIGALKVQHYDALVEKAGLGKITGDVKGQNWAKLGPFVAAMYIVTKEQVDGAQNIANDEDEDDASFVPLISYPWIFATELGRIANRDQPRSKTGIDTLTSVKDRKKAAPSSALASDPGYHAMAPLPEAAPPVLRGVFVELGGRSNASHSNTVMLPDIEAEDNASGSTTLAVGHFSSDTTVPMTDMGAPAAVRGPESPTPPLTPDTGLVSVSRWDTFSLKQIRESLEASLAQRRSFHRPTDSGSLETPILYSESSDRRSVMSSRSSLPDGEDAGDDKGEGETEEGVSGGRRRVGEHEVGGQVGDVNEHAKGSASEEMTENDKTNVDAQPPRGLTILDQLALLMES